MILMWWFAAYYILIKLSQAANFSPLCLTGSLNAEFDSTYDTSVTGNSNGVNGLIWYSSSSNTYLYPYSFTTGVYWRIGSDYTVPAAMMTCGPAYSDENGFFDILDNPCYNWEYWDSYISNWVSISSISISEGECGTITPSPTTDPYCIYDYYWCTTTTAAPNNSNTASITGAVVVISLIIVIVLVAVVFVWWYYTKRNKQLSKQHNEQTKMSTDQTAGFVAENIDESGTIPASNISVMSGGLISESFDPTKIDDDGQETPGCCAICLIPELCTLCRFRFVYFIYYIGYKTGVLYVVAVLASPIADEYDLYHHIFLGIAAFISFVFCVYLGNLSDINGRKKYLQWTVIVAAVPYLMATIYPNIWLYLCFLPIIGFVGSTSILTGLMATYIVDVVPKKYLAYSFALIHSTEGFAGLCVLIISFYLSVESVEQRVGLAVIFGLFMLALGIMSCCMKESLPLKNRNINVNEERQCFKMFIDTIKQNHMLYSVALLYLLILFIFQGVAGLIDANIHISHFNFLFFFLNIGSSLGKMLNPTVLCCANLCCKDIFVKLLFFLILLFIAVILMIAMIQREDEEMSNWDPFEQPKFLSAFFGGILFSWSKLLLPYIYVLVLQSTNKLEKGKTFGVLASVEAVCQYIGAISIISLYKSGWPQSAFVICLILVIFSASWLWFRIKLVLKADHDSKILAMDNQQKEIESQNSQISQYKLSTHKL